MANSNLTTLLKVQLDKSGIPAELKQIQKIVDKYPIQLTTDLQSTRLKKQYQSLCRDMADELNKAFHTSISGNDISQMTKSISKAVAKDKTNLSLPKLDMETTSTLTKNLASIGEAKTLSEKIGKGLTTAGNLLATLAINTGIEIIDYYIHKSDRLEENMNNAISTFRQAQNTLQEVTNVISNNKDRFVELSEGVNKFSENVSLSSDEYAEYLSISNQLAKIAPELINGHDAQGNALLKIGDNASETAKKLDNVLEKQQMAAQQETADSARKVSLGVADKVESAKEEIARLQNELDNLEDVSKNATKANLLNPDRYITFDTVEEKYKDALEQSFQKADINYEKTTWGDVTDYTWGEDVTTEQLEKAQNYYDSLIQTDQNYYDAKIAGLKLNIKEQEQIIEDAYAQMNAVMQAWMQQDFTYLGASEYGSGFKDYMDTVSNSINWSDVAKNGVELNSNADYEDYIRNQYILPIMSVADENRDEINEKFQKLLSFEEGDLNVLDFANEFQQRLDELGLQIDITPIIQDEEKLKENADKVFSQMLENEDKQAIPGMPTSDIKKRSDADKTNADEEINKQREKFYTYFNNLDKLQKEIFLEIAAKTKGPGEAISRYEASQQNNGTKKTFNEAWNADSFSQSKESLLEMAKAGQLTPGTLEGTEAFKNLLEDTGLSAQEAAAKINGYVNAVEQVSSMKSGITSITSILGERTDQEESGNLTDKGIGADVLAGMPEDVRANTEEYEHFIEVLGNGSSSMEECRNAANELATAYVNSNNFLAGLTEDTEAYYTSLLEEMGIENACQVVHDASNAKKAEEIYLSDQSVEAKLKEMGKLDQASNAVMLYTLQLQMANDNSLDTSGSVQNLINLAQTAGATAETIASLIYLNTLLSNSEMLKDAAKNATNSNEKDAILSKLNTTNELAEAQKNVVKNNADKVQSAPNGNGGNGIKLTGNRSGSGNGSSSGGSGAASKSSGTVIDWISRKLDRLNTKIDITQAHYENLVDSLGKKPKNSKNLLKAQINNLDDQIKQYKRLEKAQKNAAKRYTSKANNVTISKNKKTDEDIKKAVRDGRINAKKTPLKDLITTYGEKPAKAIQEYQKWYDAAQTAKKDYESARTSKRQKKEEKYQIQADDAQARISKLQSQATNAGDSYATQNKYLAEQSKWIKKNYDMQIEIAKLKGDTVLAADLQAQKVEELAQLEKQKFDNIKTDYDKQLGVLQGSLDYLSAQQNLIEAKGEVVTSKYYKEQAANAVSRKKLLENEKKAMVEQAKTIQKGTKEWYDAQAAIKEVDTEIINCNSDIAETNNRIIELSDSIREKLYAGIEATTTELDLLAGLMDNRDMFQKDSAELTEAGLAKLGSSAISYYNSINQKEIASQNRRIYQDIVKHYDKYKAADDTVTFVNAEGVSVTLNSKTQAAEELAKATEKDQQYTKQIYDYANQMIDFQISKLEQELSLVRKLTDDKKKQLSAEKNLHDYQKNITKQTQNIDSLQKQIVALSGDDSEEGRARVQRLQKELDDAREELSETEYDKYISDQQEMLDTLYSEYESSIEDLKSDVDTLLNMAINDTNANFGDIKKLLGDIAQGAGYELSDDVKKILASDSAEQGADQAAATLREQVRKENRDKTPPDKGDSKTLFGRFFPNLTAIYQSFYSAYQKLTNDIPQYIEITGFSRGGVIPRTLNKKLKANGDSTLVSANPGERILTAAQNASFEKFVNSDLLNQGAIYPDIANTAAKLNLPDSSRNTPCSIGDVDFHFELPNVTDSKSFLSALKTDRNLQRAVRDLTLGQITGSSSRLSVNSIK